MGNFEEYSLACFRSKSRTASARLEKPVPPWPTLRLRALSVELVLGPLRWVEGLVEVPQPEEVLLLLLGSLRRVVLLVLPEKREDELEPPPHEEEPAEERPELLELELWLEEELLRPPLKLPPPLREPRAHISNGRAVSRTKKQTSRNSGFMAIQVGSADTAL